jgi:hypothetical protein
MLLLSSLHDKYVIVPADKASNNIVFVCKSYYFECLIKELGINRYDLIKRLNALRKTGKIHSYWTHDGSVLVKKTEQSRTINIKTRKDVYKLGGEILEEDENNDV